MSTVGNSSTPGPGFFQEGVNTGDQIGTLFTMPSPGGLLTTLHGYAGTFTGTATPTLCVWDASGNLLAHVAATASVGTSPSWVSGTLATSLFVSGGTNIFIGWATTAATGFTAYFNSGGTSIWNEQASPPGSMGGNVGWTGTLGAYADYTPSQAYINTGTKASPVWTAGAVYIGTSTPANGIFVNTGTPTSPIWTPGG